MMPLTGVVGVTRALVRSQDQQNSIRGHRVYAILTSVGRYLQNVDEISLQACELHHI